MRLELEWLWASGLGQEPPPEPAPPWGTPLALGPRNPGMGLPGSHGQHPIMLAQGALPRGEQGAWHWMGAGGQ